MPEHPINLSCANCGAKLKIYDDLERFACCHCGIELITRRRDGTVELRPVTDAISKVQIGTDKAAAELAIARYQSELREIRSGEGRLSKNDSANSSAGVGCGGLILVVGLFMVMHGIDAGWWLVFGCIAGGVALFYELRKNQAELQRMRSRIRQLEALIAEKKLIVDS